MGTLRIEHMEACADSDCHLDYSLRFRGDRFRAFIESLKAEGWHQAHWYPDALGGRGAWHISHYALESHREWFDGEELSRRERLIKQQTEEAARRAYASERQRIAEIRALSNVPVQVRGAFQTLNLSITLDREPINRAYRRLAVIHHPDKHVLADSITQELHGEIFKKVNQSRDIILEWLDAIQIRPSSQTA